MHESLVGPNASKDIIFYKLEAGTSGHFSGHIHAAEAIEVDETKEDLVGEPYAVVESDPGLFGLVTL